mmetsp:Transcript_38863/g.91939  ORF Transcript_38863/g.91939 Transcript_38863/m.91939 type:complete len:400 (-) Transcript_38863:81-1280(-)
MGGKSDSKAGGFLAPKAIANRIKAKGLTKLRWYCQLCEKACRDENGYKCHTMSESHLRQVRVFADNPAEFVDSYSKEFHDAYLDVLKRKGEHVRSQARALYHEVIADRHHIHMNSTKWLTLTEYVLYLGRDGIAEVDQDEEGKWFVRYINRDPEAEARKAALERKERMDMDDAERASKMVETQIKSALKAAKAKGVDPNASAPKALIREAGAEKLSLSMAPVQKAKETVTRPPPAAGFGDDDHETTVGSKRKLSAVEEIILKDKRKKEEQERERVEMETIQAEATVTDDWLAKGIVVKVVHKKLADGKYYKKKGVVKSVKDKFTAEVKMVDTGHTLKLDQEHLETVIPSVGGEVLVVNGPYRGEVGVLRGLEEAAFSAIVTLEKSGKRSIPYEHLSKLA